MSRIYALLLLAAAGTLVITGCTSSQSIGTGSIHTAPSFSSGAKLTPDPEHIYIAPFDLETGKWLVGRTGVELYNFKREFQTYFVSQLETRLTKLAPTEQRWVDDLPDHGWLVAGEFITIYQGSRALRTVIGAGAGETTLQTKVYVYDLSISKTQYVMSFRTGVQNDKLGTGSGSGSAPAGLSALGEPVSTLSGLGSGLKLDSTRTAREIEAMLAPYAR